MAITEKCSPWLWAGDASEMVVAQIAGTQTWTAPTPVYVSTSGTVKVCVDSDTDAEVAIYGFAYADAAAPTANTEIYVAKIREDQLWAIWVSNGGNDSAAAQTIVGDMYGHSVETTAAPYVGYMTLDLALTSYKSMYVEDIVSNLNTKLVASVSTSPGAAIVRFPASVLNTVLA